MDPVFLSTPKQLTDALAAIKPNKIAVAFVGMGWSKYIPVKNLKEIIIRPSLGSNPVAIENIMKKLGNSNVHFLDSLHSKLYLGDESALMGSLNLSDNGFGDYGHDEIGIVITDSAILNEMNTVFEQYKTRAQKCYPTDEDKFEQLRKLYTQSRTLPGNLDEINGVKNPEAPSLKTFDSKMFTIHICPYGNVDIKHNIPKIQKIFPETCGTVETEWFDDEFAFPTTYKIEKSNLVLFWKKNDSNGLPNKKKKMKWFQVDEIIEGGCTLDGYNKLLVQIKGKTRNLPFKIDDCDTQDAIIKTLENECFKDFRSEKKIFDENYFYENKMKVLEFLSEAQKLLK